MTPLHRLAAEPFRQVAYFRHLVRLFGLADATRFRRAVAGPRSAEPAMIRMHPACLAHPVWLRVASTDNEVYGQVLRQLEYAGLRLDHPRTILDCGANVGFTSAYLLSRYPDARVVAVEPFAANAALCRRNLAPYGGRATVIEAAVWSSAGMITLDHPGGNEWGVRVQGATEGLPGNVPAVDIPSLGLGRIDGLKIDIEGSEAELFADGGATWLNDVGAIAIELHGPDCERIFRAAMAPYRFEESRSGELTICLGMRRP